MEAKAELNKNGDENDEDDFFDADSEKTSLKTPQKRLRKLQRDVTSSEEKSHDSCPDYFGVRSYLHQFYDTSSSIPDSEIYEIGDGDDFRYLVTPRKRHCRMNSSFWWKLAVWGGINFVVLGTIAILVGYLIPKRDVIIGQKADLEIIDRAAVKFNANLDMCKLVGLIIFCVGGSFIVLALLFPGALSANYDESFGLQLAKLDPRSPTDVKIPITEQVMRIQPENE